MDQLKIPHGLDAESIIGFSSFMHFDSNGTKYSESFDNGTNNYQITVTPTDVAFYMKNGTISNSSRISALITYLG